MIWRDIKVGTRSLLKSPGFTTAAVLCLALGFGANTAIFSIVNGVLLRSLPYGEPDGIVAMMVRSESGGDRTSSALNYDFWLKRSHSCEDLAALNGMVGGYNVSSDATAAVRASGFMVTANYFAVLGVAPAHGRTFLPEEDDPGAAPVVMLSHSLWERHFRADPGIVGEAIELNDQPYTVVGVMPEGFAGEPSGDLWLPLPYEDQVGTASYNYRVYGRLKDGVTIDEAQADADRVAEEYLAAYPERAGHGEFGINIRPLRELVVGDARLPLLLLSAAVGLVLLIACANVAHLLLARSTDRSREMAIRVAMGASRGRLVRQLLTESVLLAMIGGAIGLLLAQWGFDGMLALLPDDLPRLEEISIDWQVFGFTLGLAASTGLLFGLVPALHSFGIDVNHALKEGAGRGSTGGRRQIARSFLVSSEVALSLVLLIGAGLLLQTFHRLSSVDPGFNPRNVLTAQLSMTGEAYSTTQRVTAFASDLEGRLGSLPGVERVSVSSNLPLEQPLNLPIRLEHWQDRMQAVEYRLVSPDYFRAMGIALRSGRLFADTDSAEAPPVVIVNEAFGRQFFPDEGAVGRRLTVGFVEDAMRDIVGVVGDVRAFGLSSEAPATIYVPIGQAPDQIMQIVNSFLPLHVEVRTKGDPMAQAASLRDVVATVDPTVPVSNVRTMEQIHAASISEQRFRMWLIGAFAVLALMLSAVGLYGVTSYSVVQRTREIGLRMALGASEGSVLKLVVLRGMKLTLVGVLVGLIAAFGLTRLMSSLLYDVSPTDPATFAAIALLMVGVAAAASWIPARRAARVDPMEALRYE